MEENDKLYELILIEDESNIELIYQLTQGDETFSVDKLVNFIKDKLNDGKYYNMETLSKYYYNLFSNKLTDYLTMLTNEDAMKYYKDLIGVNYNVKRDGNNIYTIGIVISSPRSNGTITQSFYVGNDINKLLTDIESENTVRHEAYGRFKHNRIDAIDKHQKEIYDILELSKVNYLQKYAKEIEDTLIYKYHILNLILSIRNTLSDNKHHLAQIVVDTKFKDLLEKGVFPLTYQYAGSYRKESEKYVILGYNEEKNTCSVEVQRAGKFRKYKNRDVDILFKQLKDYVQI